MKNKNSFLDLLFNLKNSGLLFILGFIVVFLLTRLPKLSVDVINPDGVNWHYRSEQFVNGLKYLQFEKTYQHYHPGVTLMWITGIPIEITKIILNQNVYDNSNFLIFEGVAKYSLVFVQLLLSLFTIFLLTKSKIKNLTLLPSIILVSLFSFEPFFIGNSRLYHLDVLLTLFVFNSLLLSYFYINNINLGKLKNIYVGILAGLFLALSFLTKSIGIGALVYAVFYIVGLYIFKNILVKSKVGLLDKILKHLPQISNKNNSDIKKLLVILLSFSLFTFVLFPALWKDPVYYLTEIFMEGERVGVRKGHEQIIFGEVTTDGGIYFYPLVLLIKLSPFILITFLIYVLSNIRLKDLSSNKLGFKSNLSAFLSNLYIKLSSFDWFLGIFYLGYFLVMLFPTKKIDRYMIILYPAIAYYSYFGILNFFNLWDKNKSKLINFRISKLLSIRGISLVLLYVCVVVYPLFSFFPYYFTYYSPLFMNANTAHSIIAQKPFGVGIYELKNHILNTYGDVKLGFIDVKPMETIYPSSKVFDIRIESIGKYDLLILGPNEDFPEKVLDSNVRFVKDSSININGLEYWKIYIKDADY